MKTHSFKGARGEAAFRLILMIVVVLAMLPGIGNGQTPGAATNAPTTAPISSPVDYFRKLLAADADQLKEALAIYPPDKRGRILAKIREYKAMPLEDRILKLRVTEIRWHLTALMRLPVERRAARLAQVPEADRPLIEDRLQRWQLLPEDLQGSLLENEKTLDYLVRVGVDLERRPEAIREILPAPIREKVDARIERWRAMPAKQREGLQKYFLGFFELTEVEQQEILSSLSEAEQQEMKQSLAKFEQLPRERRKECLEALGRFTVLAPEKRYLFVRNAGRWNEMTPAEREKWREVVDGIPQVPPLPPGLNTNRMPPMPIGYEPQPVPRQD